MEEQLLDNNLTNSEEVVNVRWAGFWLRVLATIVDVLVFLPFLILHNYNLSTFKILPLSILIYIL